MASSLKYQFTVFACVVLQFCCSESNQPKGSGKNHRCYYVVPDDNEIISSYTCNYQSKCPCHDLTYYANSTRLWSNYSTFYFFPGNHNLSEVVRIDSVTDLTLMGYISDHGTKACELSVGVQNPIATVQCNQEAGFLEAGFLFKNIKNLSIIGLGFNSCGFTVNQTVAAVYLQFVSNLHMCGVGINNSYGWGLICYHVYGKSLIMNIVVDSGHSFSNYSGGNVNVTYYESLCVNSILTIAHSSITNGFNGYNTSTSAKHYAGGIDINLETTDNVHILLDHIEFVNNSGQGGGNVALFYRTFHNEWSSCLTFTHCKILNGHAHIGGGVYITMIAEFNDSNATVSSSLVVNLTDSIISNNSADIIGAGVYVQLHELNVLSAVANISFTGCLFQNNTNLISNHDRGGSAVNIINFHVPGFIPHHSPQYKLSFLSCNFTENKGQTVYSDSVGSGTLYVEENSFMIMKDCYFWSNNCTAITAVHSNIVLQGNITLRNNTSYNGGGMVLCANSMLFLDLNIEVEVLIEDCHAINFGGGIYAEFECTQAIPPCFFQVGDSTRISRALIHLKQNTALSAGTAIYGGAIDYCYSYGPYNRKNKTAVFNDLFHIEPARQNHLSNISSNPIKVCFCNELNIPDCTERTRYYHNNDSIYPGGMLSVSVAVVGQRDGPVPGIVIASLKNETHAKLMSLQNIPETNQTCTPLKYTIASDSEGQNETIDLSVGSSDFKNVLIDVTMNVSVTVKIKECPLGFELSTHTHQCECSHLVRDLQADTFCNITSESIHRSSNATWWLGVENNTDPTHSIVSGKFCPFNYCVNKGVDINILKEGFQDTQCKNHRTEILCGSCADHRSLVFGSTRCKRCHHSLSTLRVIGLILLFAVLGIILVLLVGVLNITVTEGTLNAMVFYMNVVRVNTSIFFDLPKNPNRLNALLKVFVAWMNLDWGIETCFYNGMDAVWKTGLQFVFPLYLFFLTLLVIYFSRKSSLVTKLVGKNVVHIMATIVYHFYGKILRTVIDILRASVIHTQVKGTIIVWTVDATLTYGEKRHTLLLVCAGFAIAITLSYTLALLFIQYLRKRSDMKILCWVNKLKPFFDAYTGPYKDKYHFWTGFLFVIRIGMFVAIATNVTKGEILNLTLIIATTSLLFVLVQPGIYKSWPLNITEAFTYANLTMLAAGTSYCAWLDYSNNFTVIPCVGSMFLLFCGVVVYHILKRLSETQRWRLMRVSLLDRKWPWMKRKPIRSLILPYIDPDSIDDLSSSDSELDPILQNAPPVARYDEYREPLIETGHND